MKKIILTLTLIVLILSLAACGNAAVVTESSSQESLEVSAQNGSGNTAESNAEERQFGLPVGTALVLGIVKLDETDDAVDVEQAAALLPLWKALRSFSDSETMAQAELDAVIAQIEDTMTPEQLSAIAAMGLTIDDMAGVAATLGVELGGFGVIGFGGEITEEMRATMEAARESGEFQRPGGDLPGGLGPGAGQGPGGQGGQMDPAARETAMAERSGTRGARLGINTALLDAIIKFLEFKTQ